MRSYICESCGEIGRPKNGAVPGSFAIELFLWLLFIIPGLLYTLWRLTAPRAGFCRHCRGHMIPVASPRGRLLAQQLHVPLR